MPDTERHAMNKPKKRSSTARLGIRMAGIGLALGIGFLGAGDRGSAQTSTLFGIDPFEVLNLRIKNNVLFVLDTSGSMSWVLEGGGPFNGSLLGEARPSSDDPSARLYQAKRAIESVIQQNLGTVSMGFATFNILKSQSELDDDNEEMLVYVSQDAAASNFANFFDDLWNGGTTFSTVSGADSQDTFRSFGNDRFGYIFGYPAGCTPGVDCRYWLESALFRDGRRYTWDRAAGQTTTLLATNTITCPLPPADLTGINPDNDGDGFADLPRPCVPFQDGVGGPIATYYMTGGHFERTGGSSCGGAAVLQSVADCATDNSAAILAELQPEILIPPTWVSGNAITGLGSPNSVTNLQGRQPVGGVRATQSTPLGRSIDAIRTANPAAFPPEPAAVAGLQKNFVILLTDGDDTCGSCGGSSACFRPNAIEAAQKAKQLFDNTGDSTHWAETLVVAFTAGVNPVNANFIAQGGSGAIVDNAGNITGPAGNPCRDAFLAGNQDELVAVLNNALTLAASTGTFSASPSILSTVYELSVPPADPLDPSTRYDQRVNVLFAPKFDIPTFEGELSAFENSGTFPRVSVSENSTGDWEAGQTLFDNVSDPMATTRTGSRGTVNEFLFSELHAGQTVDTIGVSAVPIIKRRILTSSDNGRFVRTTDAEFDSAAAAGRNVVALWPPSQFGLNSGVAFPAGGIDPDDPAVAGLLDDVLGIGAASSPVLTFAELRDTLGACAVSTDDDPLTAAPVLAPALCLANDIDTARKEARQIILAWIAGAELRRSEAPDFPTGDGLPMRNGLAGLTQGELIYKDRGWLMSESTLGTPAIMTPPLRSTPNNHVREWILFRDGRRDSNREGIDELDLGFGLRNPDFDDSNPQTKLSLKPRKTIIFFPTNLYMHALSAETSEELWAYIAHDQLDKIVAMMTGTPARDPHIYTHAASVRLVDIFVPEPFTLGGEAFDGRWRTVIYFGRGPGGKHITALDVTAPGPFTRSALETNPPYVMWNRGNPDEDQAGVPIRAADTIPYSFMGETWSTPAVGNVNTAVAGFPEWRIWMGSGYSEDPDEGTVYYDLDALTGDVMASFDVGDGTPTHFPDNAMPASAAAWNEFQLDPPNIVQRSTADYVTRVFIPDVHGRVWKFSTVSTSGMFRDEGPDHPFGDGVALMKLAAGDFVFGNSGNDLRVAPPPAATPPFSIFGWQDIDGDACCPTPSGSTPVAFSGNTDPIFFYPDIFRAATSPLTVFTSDGLGRVFFVGVRYNAPDITCISSFDAILFALGAETGASIYDFDGDNVADPSTIITGKKPGNLEVKGGRIVIGDQGAVGAAPVPPPPDAVPTPAPPAPPYVNTEAMSASSPICRQ